MIAANTVIARFLSDHGIPALQRIVRTPERWARIVALAQGLREWLPEAPSSRELSAFLLRRREADPLRFPDLSLAVVKLLGPGEYALVRPGEHLGHFGLAAPSYTHSTAPNRRYPDLITQRLLKATLSGEAAPYGESDLDLLARHCTEREDASRKVERLMRKVAAATLLSARIGEVFEAVVTGAVRKGTFVRVLSPPVEGRVVVGEAGMDVGARVRVRLIATDPLQGYIDFART
jgi:exoribonuclease-2